MIPYIVMVKVINEVPRNENNQGKDHKNDDSLIDHNITVP